MDEAPPTLDACKALPRRPSVTWFAEYLQDPDDPQFAMTVWIAPKRRELIGFTLGRPSDPAYPAMLAAMLLCPISGKPMRPGRVYVAHRGVHEILQPMLAPLEVEVELKPPAEGAQKLLDSLRPQIILQFMLDAGIADGVDVNLRNRLLSAYYAIQQCDPWTRLTTPIGFQVQGLRDEPIALILDRDFESRSLLVTALGHGPIRNMAQLTERIGGSGVLFVLEKSTVLGEEDFWPHLMTSTEGTLNDEQVSLLVAALEVICIATQGEAEMGNAASFVLKELVAEPTTVEVMRLPAPPGSARRRTRAARHATRTRGRQA